MSSVEEKPCCAVRRDEHGTHLGFVPVHDDACGGLHHWGSWIDPGGNCCQTALWSQLTAVHHCSRLRHCDEKQLVELVHGVVDAPGDRRQRFNNAVAECLPSVTVTPGTLTLNLVSFPLLGT
jgi:hypothetical protein